MEDLVLICRSATEDSLIGNVGLAMEARGAGRSVAVVFTEEALAALGGESFGWSPLLQNRDARMTISRNAKAAGLPVSSERDERWTDLPRLMSAAREAGVRLVACPIWTQLLGLDGRLPQLESMPKADYLAMLTEAGRVLGGF
jgi:peroxiredoxin family protein